MKVCFFTFVVRCWWWCGKNEKWEWRLKNGDLFLIDVCVCVLCVCVCVCVHVCVFFRFLLTLLKINSHVYITQHSSNYSVLYTSKKGTHAT